MQSKFIKEVQEIDKKMERYLCQIKLLKRYKKILLTASELSKELGDLPTIRTEEISDKQSSENYQ